MNSQEKQRIQSNLKARKLRLKLVKDEFNRLQYLAEDLAVMNFRDEARLKELDKEVEQTPTIAYGLKVLTMAVLFLLPFFLFAQDTIFVKNVFINGKKVKVRSGYIIHNAPGYWVVNGKRVELYEYKQTNNSEFKPDSLIAKK